MQYDLFLSHASEDKPYVEQLAGELRRRGYLVWLDSTELVLGDSLSQKIDAGLANSRFGVVILSEKFFAKQWTMRELNGLVAREVLGKKVILPVWHGIDGDVVVRHSPTLADRRAANSAHGVVAVCDEIARVAPPTRQRSTSTAVPARVPMAPSSTDLEASELRAKYADDEVCPRCGREAHAFGYDGPDGDTFDWLECGHCHLFLPLYP